MFRYHLMSEYVVFEVQGLMFVVWIFGGPSGELGLSSRTRRVASFRIISTDAVGGSQNIGPLPTKGVHYFEKHTFEPPNPTQGVPVQMSHRKPAFFSGRI